MSCSSPLILGINGAYHETSAALICDGRIVAAVEEERLTGVKHGKPVRVDNAHELPWQAMEWCLRQGGRDWGDLDAVAYSFDPELRRCQASVVPDGSPDDFGHPEGEARFLAGVEQAKQGVQARTGAPFHFIGHHVAHAWYAIGSSPFDQAAILVLDGIGEGASCSLGRATRSHIHLQHQDLFPHSVGLSWEKTARFLGMSSYDACKLMALAGFSSDDTSRQLSLDHAMMFENGRLRVDQGLFSLEHPEDLSGLTQWCGMEASWERAINVSGALQRATQNMLLDIAHHLHQQTGLDKLVYGGGVALNCRANAELAGRGPFNYLHAGPASHDAGTALGAAWAIHAEVFGGGVPLQDSSRILFSGPELGGAFPDEDLDWHAVDSSLLDMEQTVSLLEGGTVIGWVSGPCEFGPRALGGRSLLALPSYPGMVEFLNAFKGRQNFEPFAISVTSERASELFDIPESGRTLADSMLITVRPRGVWHERLREVVHQDGTVRLQVVHRDRQPDFHALLSHLGQDGWPLLINTSLNPRGKPMAASLAMNIDLFSRLGLEWAWVEGVLWHHSGATTSKHVYQAPFPFAKMVSS